MEGEELNNEVEQTAAPAGQELPTEATTTEQEAEATEEQTAVTEPAEGEIAIGEPTDDSL